MATNRPGGSRQPCDVKLDILDIIGGHGVFRFGCRLALENVVITMLSDHGVLTAGSRLQRTETCLV